MPQCLLKAVLIVIMGFLAVIGAPWALRPFLSPPGGISPSGWSFAQLIRERYPVRLIDPGWLSNNIYWMFAETGARLFLVVCSIGFPFAVTLV